MKDRLKYNWVINLLPFLLAAGCLLSAVLGSNQSILSLPVQQCFHGEYSRDGETWSPLDDSADLSALDGDLMLRSHFAYDIIEGGRLYFYQNHIGVTIYVNGV